MNAPFDVTGKRFTRLRVLKRQGSFNGHAMWLCLCDCGQEYLVSGPHLVRGHTKSCGCLWKEKSKSGELGRKHGKRGHPLYNVMSGMLQRCYNPKSKSYKNYGAKGITVCMAWKKSITNFYNWAVDNGWEKGKEIHRVNANLGYSPNNCKILVKSEHRKIPKINGRYFTYKGKTLNIKNWERFLGVNGLIYCRLRRGWSFKRAITTPAIKQGNTK